MISNARINPEVNKTDKDKLLSLGMDYCRRICSVNGKRVKDTLPPPPHRWRLINGQRRYGNGRVPPGKLKREIPPRRCKQDVIKDTSCRSLEVWEQGTATAVNMSRAYTVFVSLALNYMKYILALYMLFSIYRVIFFSTIHEEKEVWDNILLNRVAVCVRIV